MADAGSIGEPRDDASGGADWVPLGHAATLLGVAPRTLRRWADEGRIPFVVTAGGHRRFSQRTLAEFLPRAGSARGGPIAPAVAAAIFQAVPAAGGPSELSGWPKEPGEAGLAAMREQCGPLLEAMLEHLDLRGVAAQRRLRDACALAAEYGAHFARLGIPIVAITRAHVMYERDFMDEVAAGLRGRGAAGRDPLDVLVRAQRASGEIHIAMVEGYEQARPDAGQVPSAVDERR